MRTPLQQLITRAKELGLAGEQADEDLVYEQIRIYLENDRGTLQQIMQVIGPESVCQCAGCQYETNEAIRLLKTLGVDYLMRKKRRRKNPAHDPDVERLGNVVVPRRHEPRGAG